MFEENWNSLEIVILFFVMLVFFSLFIMQLSTYLLVIHNGMKRTLQGSEDVLWYDVQF